MGRKKITNNFQKQISYKKIDCDDAMSNTHEALETLENSWNEGYHSMTLEERFMFLEVTEKVVRVHTKLKGFFELEEQMKKN